MIMPVTPLIALATFQLLEESNITYQVVNTANFNPRGKVLIYGGGGNFVKTWTIARRTIKTYYPFLKKLIILPHTINSNEDVLGSFGSNVDVICREKISFNHVKKNAPKSNVLLMDDMAFYLNIEKIIDMETISFLDIVYSKWRYACEGDDRQKTMPPLKNLVIKNMKLYFKTRLNRLKRQSGDVLNCFRTDKERTGIKRPWDNLDLSKLFAHGTENYSLALYSSCKLLKFLNQYNIVRTDRLHLCIAGALLGKNVKMYPNNYYKNEAVYQHSIKDKFPNVIWMG